MTQVVTTESWGSRLGGSIKGVITGIILVLVAIVLLWWNEGRAVSTAKALAEGKSEVISINPASIDAANEGKLVHATADAVTSDILQDPAFGISENAICLKREVQIYQWVETSSSQTRKKLGGGTETVTTYTYSQAWCKEPVDSNKFVDEKARVEKVNTGMLRFEDQEQYATSVNFGAFRFSEENIKRISGAEPYRFAADAKLPESLGPNAYVSGLYVIIPNPLNAVTAPAVAAVADQALTAVVATQAANAQAAAAPGQTAAQAAQAAQAVNTAAQAAGQVAAQAVVPAAAPAVQPGAAPAQIGDLRVKFTIIRPHKISIAAAQKGDTFTSYVASNDETIFLMSDGEKSAKQMFTSAEKGNSIMTWVLRIIGFLLMKAGFSSILRPLSVLGDVVPFIGNIIGAGIGIISTLVAFPLSLLVIAIAWLFYRPVVSIALLVAIGAGIFFLFKKIKEKKAAAVAA